jgi:hypothetical protein
LDFTITQTPVDALANGGTATNHNVQLSCSTSPVTYTSQSPTIATVDNTGYVQWVSDGTATILVVGPISQKTTNVAVSQTANTIFGGSTVPFNIQPQSVISTTNWPSHAVIFLPKAWAPTGTLFHITEDGVSVPSQIEIAAKWREDNSAKVIHVHYNWKYAGGDIASYILVKGSAVAPLATMVVTDPGGTGAITIDTGAIVAVIQRAPFLGLSSVTLKSNGTQIINAGGGPSLLDGNGVTFHSQYDSAATVVVEQTGTHRVTIKATGTYKNNGNTVTPFCLFVTRFIFYVNSALVKVDHATIFSESMKTRKIAELKYKFGVNNTLTTGVVSADGATDTVNTGTTTVTRMHQWDYNQARLYKDSVITTKSKGDGWFSMANSGNFAAVALLTKHFWEKYPTQVDIGTGNLTYYQWPNVGALTDRVAADTNLENVYKFRYLHTGQYFDETLPQAYWDRLANPVTDFPPPTPTPTGQTDTKECRPEFAANADLSGVAWHNEFALYFYNPSVSGTPTPAQMQTLYNQNPIGKVHRAYAAASGFFGPVSANNDTMSTFMADCIVGMFGSVIRFNEYGQWNYADIHDEQFMADKESGIPRPSLHRVWGNCHYRQHHIVWDTFALTDDPRLLPIARAYIDKYASVGIVHYDANRTTVIGGTTYGPPETQWHQVANNWHCKGFIIWGMRQYAGVNTPDGDDDGGTIQHWTCPTAYLHAWLIDHDRWAKDAFDLYYANYRLAPIGPNNLRYTNREYNNGFGDLLHLEAYQPSTTLTNQLLTYEPNVAPYDILVEYNNGAKPQYWNAETFSMYQERFPTNTNWNNYVIDAANRIGVSPLGIWTMNVNVTAYRLTGNIAYLQKFYGLLTRALKQLYVDPTGFWDKYGYPLNLDGMDGHFVWQYPRYLKALEDAGLANSIPVIDEAMYWIHPTGIGNDIAINTGTKILVKNTLSTIPITCDGFEQEGGGITHLEVYDPSNVKVLDVPRMPMSAGGSGGTTRNHFARLSSWDIFRETYSVATAINGLYTICFDGQGLTFGYNLTGQPECQILKRSPYANAAYVKVFKGYLVDRVASGVVTLTPTMFVPSQNTGLKAAGHIKIVNANNVVCCDQWIFPGRTPAVPNVPLTQPGPWAVDIFCDYTGSMRISIGATGTTVEPLYAGTNLADINAIKAIYGA